MKDGQAQVLHLKTFHPLNDWYGLSALEAAAIAVDQHNAVSTHNLAILQNGGRPSGALIVNPSTQRALSHMTPEQREALWQDISNTHKGAQNAGRMMILEGDFDWKEMGLSPKDLDFVAGKLLSAREIAQAFGVPSMLVGVPGESTFSNYREARFHLWEDTILPLLEKIIAELNKVLIQETDAELSYNPDAIPALAPRREAVWKRVQNADFLSDEEKRALVGAAKPSF